MSIWEPFAEQARRSIVVAQEFAQELGANHIDGDHIFIGVVCEAGSPAAEIMASYGATPESVRDAARRVLAQGKRNVEELVFTADGKRTIELAFETARELGQRYIAPEHVAVGFLRAAGRNSPKRIAHRRRCFARKTHVTCAHDGSPGSRNTVCVSR